MSSNSTKPQHRLIMRRLEISREEGSPSAGKSDNTGTAQKIELPEDRGTLLIESTSQCKVDYVYDNVIEYRNLVGRYRTEATGFWVIFLDGMRWYPLTRDGIIQVKFGPGTSHYVPRFINSRGEVLGSYMTAPELSQGPLFSFIPRNRPIWDSILTACSFYDIHQTSSQTQVYIQDSKEELMVIPNGRMIIWYAGSLECPPTHFWNMLRQRSSRIDTPEPLESHPDAKRAQEAEIPRSIRVIAQEIGGLF